MEKLGERIGSAVVAAVIVIFDIQDRRRFSARDMGGVCIDTVGARGIGGS